MHHTAPFGCPSSALDSTVRLSLAASILHAFMLSEAVLQAKASSHVIACSGCASISLHIMSCAQNSMQEGLYEKGFQSLGQAGPCWALQKL